jgi:hypothetical protein
MLDSIQNTDRIDDEVIARLKAVKDIDGSLTSQRAFIDIWNMVSAAYPKIMCRAQERYCALYSGNNLVCYLDFQSKKQRVLIGFIREWLESHHALFQFKTIGDVDGGHPDWSTSKGGLEGFSITRFNSDKIFQCLLIAGICDSYCAASQVAVGQ